MNKNTPNFCSVSPFVNCDCVNWDKVNASLADNAERSVSVSGVYDRTILKLQLNKKSVTINEVHIFHSSHRKADRVISVVKSSLFM